MAVTYLLDTNSCVEQLRRGPTSSLSVRLSQAAPGDVVLCSVVVAELLFGALRSAKPAEGLTQVQNFCRGFSSLPFDDSSAAEYGEIRAHLIRVGLPIGPNDLMIASIARANQLILVTHNVVEFSRVPGLTVEDWQSP
jgi:tRNA(fMet)-specific endonuclease VapC